MCRIYSKATRDNLSGPEFQIRRKRERQAIGLFIITERLKTEGSELSKCEQGGKGVENFNLHSDFHPKMAG